MDFEDLQLADVLDVSPQKTEFFTVNAFDVATRPDYLEILACCKALAGSGIQVDDVAVGIHELFLFFLGSDDFRVFPKPLITDISGAKKAAFTGDASRFGCG